MKEKLIEWLGKKDSSKYHSINKLIIAVRNPRSREDNVAIRKELIALINSGEIEIDGDVQRLNLIDVIDPTLYSDANGNALPRRYNDFENIGIHARGKGPWGYNAAIEKPAAAPSLPQRFIPEFSAPPEGAKRAEFKGIITAKDEIDQPHTEQLSTRAEEPLTDEQLTALAVEATEHTNGTSETHEG